MTFASILGDYLIFLIITFGFLSCAFTISLIRFRFPSRTVDDVISYLRPVDRDAAKALVDPIMEGWLRRDLTAAEFRATQRKRIYLYIELLKRMFHNSGILVEWASTEAEHMEKEVLGPVRRVHKEAVQVRAYTLFTIVKLRFWLAIRLHSWRVFPAPSLAETRESGGIEGLESYDRLKTAAGRLFLELKSNRLEELIQVL